MGDGRSARLGRAARQPPFFVFFLIVIGQSIFIFLFLNILYRNPKNHEHMLIIILWLLVIGYLIYTKTILFS